MPFLKKIFTNGYFILAILASVFVLLFSATTSPLYIDHRCWFHGDAGIFQEMGLLILQGGTPYIDLFDHKGPILFFIQALGLWISKDWGLYVLQVLSLTMTLIVWHKMVRVLSDQRWMELVIPAITLCFLLLYYQRGDLCEEWSLFFISLPIYFCLKEIVSLTTIFRKEFLLIGVCVGVISFIRINNVAPLIPFVVSVLGHAFLDKRYIDLGQAVLCMAIGFLSVAFVCCFVFYLYAGWSGVYEMLYGTFIFNFIYFSNSGNEFSGFETVCFYIPILFFLLMTFLFKKKSSGNLTIIISLSYIISLLSIGKSCYLHYQMVFLPLYLLTLCIMFGNNRVFSTILTIVIALFSLSCDYSALDNLLARVNNKVPSYKDSDFHRFIENLPLEEKMSIYNEYAFPVCFFVEEKLVQCNRFVLPGHVHLTPRLFEHASCCDLCDIEPIWVLLKGNTQLINHNANDLLNSKYFLADSIYTMEQEIVHCYKKL